MALPQFTMSELLEAGVHFGHRTHRWNPQMAPYIYGSRNGIHIIDLQQTVPMMFRALGAIRHTVAGGGRVLFVGTKKQAQNPVIEAAERCGQYYVTHRWLGGMLTNWKTINNSIRRLKNLEDTFAREAEVQARIDELMKDGEPAEGVTLPKLPLAHLTKKERLMMQREHDKLNLTLGGIKNMGGLPDIIVVMDAKLDRIAIDEAKTLGIPVIGILDSNSDPANITHPIPGNDDSSRSLRLYMRLFSDAVLDGIKVQASKMENREVVMSRSGSSSDSQKRETTVKLSPRAAAAAESEGESEEQKAEATESAPAEDAKKAKEKAVEASSDKSTEEDSSEVPASAGKEATAKQAVNAN